METEVIDSLDSTDSFSALSANQGHVLYNMINNLVTGTIEEDGTAVLILDDRVFQNSSV